jgi:acetoin utilization protein AcuB
MRVADRMTANPVSISSTDTLATARGLMDRGKFRALPVLENGTLIGIVTDRDLRKHEGLAGKAVGYLEGTKVTDAMTPDPMTVPPESLAMDAARLLVERKIGGLPVMDKGKLVGIVTTSDLLRALVDMQATAGFKGSS